MAEQERRGNPRYAFIANAEVIEQASQARIATRVSELSLTGCYLDMMTPLPMNELLLVKITAGQSVFQAKTKVIYSHANLGIGVSFLDVEPKYMAVLRGWLAEAEKDPQRLLA